MRLEVVGQSLFGHALDQQARPVHADAVFPLLAGLVREGLREDRVVVAGDFIDAAKDSSPFHQLVGPERIPEARCEMLVLPSSHDPRIKLTCVREEHAQRDFLLLLVKHQFPLGRLDEYLFVPEFRQPALDLVAIVERELALLD